MKHTTTSFLLELLECRRHLSSAPIAAATHAHAPALTPQQQAQLEAALLLTLSSGSDPLAAIAASLAPPNPLGTDALTALSSPDLLDQLVTSGSSITTDSSPTVSAPSETVSSVFSSVLSPFSIDALAIDPSSLNL